MKKKYQYNGKFYTESEMSDFAKQSGMDLNSYTKELGENVKVHDAPYEFNGKEFSEDEIGGFAKESGLDVNSYLKEAGIKKADTIPTTKELQTTVPVSTDGVATPTLASPLKDQAKLPVKPTILPEQKVVANETLVNTTKDNFQNNPLFQDSNPNAQKNKDIYINHLASKGVDKNVLLQADNDVQKYKQLYSSAKEKLDVNSADHTGTYEMGTALLGLNKPDEAITLFKATLNALPNKKNKEQPFVYAEDARQQPNNVIPSNNPANSLFGIGNALSQKGDYKGSIEYYDKALQADPNNIYAQKGLAYSKYKLGDKEGSSEHIKQAKALEGQQKSSEALTEQIGAEAKDLTEQQRQSDEMKTIADGTESMITYPTRLVGRVAQEQIEGAGAGLKKVYEGINEGVDTPSGFLKAGAGAAQTVFSVIPQVAAFNLAVKPIQDFAEANPDNEIAQKAYDVSTIPFTLYSHIAKWTGHEPTTDNEKNLAQIGDLLLMVGAHKAGIKGVNNLKDYGEKVKEMAAGKLPIDEIKKINLFNDYAKNLTLDKVELELQKQNTPEAKKALADINNKKLNDARDLQVTSLQKQGILPPDEHPIQNIPKSIITTIDRIHNGQPTDPTQVAETSDYLYKEYKRLGELKSDHTRTYTTDQINAAQEELAQAITELENHKQEQNNISPELKDLHKQANELQNAKVDEVSAPLIKQAKIEVNNKIQEQVKADISKTHTEAENIVKDGELSDAETKLQESLKNNKGNETATNLIQEGLDRIKAKREEVKQLLNPPKEAVSDPIVNEEKPSRSDIEKELGLEATKLKEEVKPPIVSESKKADVIEKPITEISVDEKRFQNRTELDQKKLKDISENFDKNQLDPVVIWKDPKTGKDFLLAGHHRLKGSEMAGEKNIPARYFEGTEHEAIKYAKDISNANRTMEADFDRAKRFRELREGGASKKELSDFLEREGKNAAYIENISHLNPRGKAFEALKTFVSAGDKTTQKVIEKIADFVGAARKNYEQLTNAHENEMFDFLNTDKGQEIKSRTEFLNIMNNRINRLEGFNSEELLNFAHKGIRGTLESEVVKNINDLKRQKTDLQNEIKKAQKTIADKPTRDKKISDLTKQVIETNKKIGDLEKKQTLAAEADRAQYDIFDNINNELENGNITEQQVNDFIESEPNPEHEKLIEAIESETENIEGVETERLKELESELGGILDGSETKKGKGTNRPVDGKEKGGVESQKEGEPLSKKEKLNKELSQLIAERNQKKLESKLGKDTTKQGFLSEDDIDFALRYVKNRIEAGIEDVKVIVKEVVDYFKKEGTTLSNDDISKIEKAATATNDIHNKWTGIAKRNIADADGILHSLTEDTKPSDVKHWKQSTEEGIDELQKVSSENGDSMLKTAQDKVNEWLQDPSFNPNDVEVTQILFHRTKIMDEIGKLKEEMLSDNEAVRNVAKEQLKQRKEQLASSDKLLEQTGKVAGRAFNLRQAVGRIDAKTGLEVKRMELINKKGGELSEKEEKALLAQHEAEIASFKAENEKLKKDIATEVKRQVDKIISESGGREAKPKDKQAIARQTKEWANNVRKLKIPKEYANLRLDLGAWDGIVEAAAKAIETTGDIAQAIKNKLDELKIKYEDKDIVSLVDKIKNANKDVILDKIKELSDEAGTKNITLESISKNHIKELVRHHIEQGLRGDEILKAVREDLKTLFPDITEQQVTNAFLKQGEYELPKKERLLDENAIREKNLAKRLKLEQKLENLKNNRSNKKNTPQQNKVFDADIAKVEAEIDKFLKDKKFTKEAEKELEKYQKEMDDKLSKTPKSEIEKAQNEVDKKIEREQKEKQKKIDSENNKLDKEAEKELTTEERKNERETFGFRKSERATKKKFAERRNKALDIIIDRLKESATEETKDVINALVERLEETRIEANKNKDAFEQSNTQTKTVHELIQSLAGKEGFEQAKNSLSDHYFDIRKDEKSTTRKVNLDKWTENTNAAIKRNNKALEKGIHKEANSTQPDLLNAASAKLSITKKKSAQQMAQLIQATQRAKASKLEKFSQLILNGYVQQLIGNIKTQLTVGASAILKQPAETANKTTFGNLAALLNPSLMKAAGSEGFSSFKQEKARYSAMLGKFSKEQMLEKVKKANDRLMDADVEMEQATQSGNAKRIKKAKEQQLSAALDASGNAIYEWLGSDAYADSYNVLTKGTSTLEKLLGEGVDSNFKDKDWIEKWDTFNSIMGATHAYMKNYSARAQFAADFMARLENKANRGVDIRSADELTKNALESFISFQRGKFQQDNVATQIYGGMMRGIQNIDNPGARILGQILLKVEQPVVRTSTNIAGEAVLGYTMGSLYGGLLHAKELYSSAKDLGYNFKEAATNMKAVKDNLKYMDSEKADTILRAYRRGGVGALGYALAATGVLQFGGFWTNSGNDKNKGKITLGGVELDPLSSKIIMHTPFFMPALMTANWMKVKDSKNKDGENKGNWEALVSDVEAATETIPLMPAASGFHSSTLMNVTYPFVGNLARGFSEVADNDGTSIWSPRKVQAEGVEGWFKKNFGMRSMLDSKSNNPETNQRFLESIYKSNDDKVIEPLNKTIGNVLKDEYEAYKIEQAKRHETRTTEIKIHNSGRPQDEQKDLPEKDIKSFEEWSDRYVSDKDGDVIKKYDLDKLSKTAKDKIAKELNK